VRRWNERTEIPAGRLVGWLGITSSKFHDWRRRYGKVNEHNAWIPRDWWLIGGPRGGDFRRPRPQAGRVAGKEESPTRGDTPSGGCLIA